MNEHLQWEGRWWGSLNCSCPKTWMVAWRAGCRWSQWQRARCQGDCNQTQAPEATGRTGWLVYPPSDTSRSVEGGKCRNTGGKNKHVVVTAVGSICSFSLLVAVVFIAVLCRHWNMIQKPVVLCPRLYFLDSWNVSQTKERKSPRVDVLKLPGQ